MAKLKQKMYDNCYFVCLVTIFLIGMLIYLSESTSNVPVMDYWRYLNALVDKFFTKGISFSDLYSNNGIHRTPVQLFLFLLNIVLFHWNTQISIYLGAVILCITACVLYKIMKPTFTNKGIGYYLCIFIMVLTVFTLGSYEILLLEFSTSFALRNLTFITGYYWTNKFLENNQKWDSRACYLSMYYIFVICAMGGAYSMGFAASVLFVLFFDFCKKMRKKEGVCYRNYVVLSLGVIFGVSLYLYGVTDLSTGNIGGSFDILQLLYFFFHGTLIVLGSSLVGNGLSVEMLTFFGIMVLMIHFICIYLYVSNRIYEITYIPIFMYIYLAIFIVMILMGRNTNGVEYLSASRYICDSSMGIISDVIILSFYLSKSKIVFVKRKIMSYFLIGILCLGTFYADITELKISKYRKIYYDNLIEMMLNLDDYTDDELTPFQAQMPEQVRNGVMLMKKYRLGIFYNIDMER